MAATADKTDVKPADVLAALSDETMPVKDLLALVPAAAVSAAWAKGLIEFGRRKSVGCGNLAKSDGYILVESGVEWSGGKSSARATFKELWEAEPDRFPERVPIPGPMDPVTGIVGPSPGTTPVTYRTTDRPREKATAIPYGFDPQKTTPNYDVPALITRKEALEMLALLVRLSDKGLAKLQGE